MNKMAPRGLFYVRKVADYGNSKGAKLKMFMRNIMFPSLKLVYDERVFQIRQRMLPFLAGTNGE